MSDDLKPMIVKALKHRLTNGRHLHHRSCIHNMPPEEQIAMRGKTVEWWQAMGIPMPEQITPEQWECEDPFATDRGDGDRP